VSVTLEKNASTGRARARAAGYACNNAYQDPSAARLCFMKHTAERLDSLRTVELSDGRRLAVRAWPGDGRPLVLLHGLLDSSAGWADLVSRSSHPCIAVDLPGFGHSPAPTRPRLSAYADDVVTALRALTVRSFTLVGHSLGGGVATAVAERMRKQTRALVLCAPAGFGRIPLAELAALPLLRAVAAESLPHLMTRRLLVRAIYASVVTRGIAPTDELIRRLAGEAARVGPGVRTALEALAASGQSSHAFHRRTVAYDGPVCALWGGRDALVPTAHISGLRSALPQAKIHVWPGMGHHPQRERPAEFAALLNEAHRAAHTKRDCRRPHPPARPDVAPAARVRAPASSRIRVRPDRSHR
jgi:pimeloyl-ACP methyl ester carboxylesterase